MGQLDHKRVAKSNVAGPPDRSGLVRLLDEALYELSVNRDVLGHQWHVSREGGHGILDRGTHKARFWMRHQYNWSEGRHFKMSNGGRDHLLLNDRLLRLFELHQLFG